MRLVPVGHCLAVCNVISRFFVLLTLCAVSWPGLVRAQNGVTPGQWRYHAYFGRDTLLALSPSTVYTSFGNCIMTYDRATGELDVLSKINGLSQVNVTALTHAYDRDLLAVGYRSGAVDLLAGGRTFTLDALQRANLIGDKAILGIDIIGRFAFVTGSFGFFVIDINRREIRFSNTAMDPTGQNRPVTVRGTCLQGGRYYFATSIGILSVSTEANLQDIRQFRVEAPSANNGLPINGGALKAVGTEGQRVYAVFEQGGIFARNDTTNVWEIVPGIASLPFRNLRGVAGRLLLAAGSEIYRIQGRSFTQLAPTDTLLATPYVALQDRDDEVWAASLAGGLVQIRGTQTRAFETSSPPFQVPFKLYGYQDRVVAVAGGFSSSAGVQLGRREGIGIFTPEGWIRYGATLQGLARPVFDISDVAYDKRTRNLYFGTYGNGVCVIPDDNKLRSYCITDTSRRRDGNRFFNAFGQGLGVRVPSVTVDRNGNLWATNFADTAFHLRDRDNKWFAYVPPPANRAALVEVKLDDQFNQYLRARPGASQGNNSLAIRSADGTRWGYINRNLNSGNLPDPDIYDMAIDRQGALWLATGAGLGVLYNPTIVFPTNPADPARTTPPFNVTLPIFDGRPLLENDICTALLLDGGDRKWVGTRTSGVWLFDKDVSQVLAHYTADNSPLPSNSIVDMAMVPASGELFVSTENGLVSLSTLATDASLRESENSCVKVFPNPVRPDYKGSIGIECLPDNAVVKITDAAGRLVYENRAAGGGLIWNGFDYLGRRPQPGVYLIYATTEDRSTRVVGRFAIIE